MKKALRQISKSPFTRGIEKVKLPRRFHQPTFAIYNGQTDSVEHVSQFKQKMAVHSQDEALMCRIFPSNLGPMPMRWFDGLRTNSISSFKKLTQSFCSRFITCSRVPQPLDSLLSMSIREGNPEKCNHNLYCQYHQDHGHKGLQKSMGSLGPARLKGHIKTATISFQWSGEPGKL